MDHRTGTAECRGRVLRLANRAGRAAPGRRRGCASGQRVAPRMHRSTPESAGGVGGHPPRIDATGRSR